MIPKIILHNSISLDGSLINFDVDMETHYKIAGSFKPDIRLIGSNTIKTGMDIYGELTPEKETDFIKTDKNHELPYWVIPDTKGILKNMLHALRGFEFCREVIILISKETPRDYIDYLKERNYEYHVVGEKQIDIKKSLEILSKEYNVKTILTDTGKILGNLLLNQGFVKEISLIVHPIIVGSRSYNMFGNIDSNFKLKLLKCETFNNGLIWLVYDVLNP